MVYLITSKKTNRLSPEIKVAFSPFCGSRSKKPSPGYQNKTSADEQRKMGEEKQKLLDKF